MLENSVGFVFELDQTHSSHEPHVGVRLRIQDLEGYRKSMLVTIGFSMGTRYAARGTVQWEGRKCL